MPTVTSSTETVTVAGISCTYSLSLSVSPTSLPSSGGQVTLIATLTSNDSSVCGISGQPITFTETTTGTTQTAVTDSGGAATVYFNLPANDTTSSETYSFEASYTYG